MATLVATKHNPVIRARYEHLQAMGEAKMVALIACMRKLITLLNTMIRDQVTWEAIDESELTFKTVATTATILKR